MPTPGPTNANFLSYASEVIDVKRDFAAQGDGITDDSTAINAAISAASGRFGAGVVYFPPGTYLVKSTITMLGQVHLRGAGIEATIIKLGNGVNADLISSGAATINLGASFGSSSSGGIYNWSMENLTLDGNKANQSSGPSYCLRIYGYGYILSNIRVRNGYYGGVQVDWNGGTTSPGQDSFAAQISNVKIHDTFGPGLQIGGPSGSQLANIEIFGNSTHGLHIAPNARGLLVSNLSSYGVAQGVSGGAVALLCEANNCVFTGCLAQDSDTVQVALLASTCMFTGKVVGGTGSATSSGIQIGQAAGNTPYNGQMNQSAGLTTAVSASGNFVEGILDSNLGTNGQLWLANDGGQNFARVIAKQASGPAVTGTIAGTSSISSGVTPNGGTISTTSPALTTSGTIATAASVARVTPAAAVTGIIMQAGVVPGQMCLVDNQGAASATITFNTNPATSHVSNAAAASVIPGLAGRLFTWDGSFWVPAHA